MVDFDAVQAFVQQHNRAVLVTHRRAGLQTSPIRVRAIGGEFIEFITRAPTAKARNLAARPPVALCVLDDRWFGPWMGIEGIARSTPLPEALPSLIGFYTWRDGPIADLAEFTRTMQDESRVIVRVQVTKATTP